MSQLVCTLRAESMPVSGAFSIFVCVCVCGYLLLLCLSFLEVEDITLAPLSLPESKNKWAPLSTPLLMNSSGGKCQRCVSSGYYICLLMCLHLPIFISCTSPCLPSSHRPSHSLFVFTLGAEVAPFNFSLVINWMPGLRL